MRWLLVKDLQIMRRSPLLTALLVVYPIVIAVLIGYALSRGPERPTVAFLNEVPERTQESPFEIGGEEFDVAGARNELCTRLECVPVDSRREAREKVERGEVLGALILPEDLVSKLSAVQTGSLTSPVVDVLVNEEDPLKRQLVDDRIQGLLTEANLRLSQAVSDVTLDYLELLLGGGSFTFLGQRIDVLGLERSEEILTEVQGALPPGPERASVRRVVEFAGLARQNLDFADELLGSVSQPIEVRKEVVAGSAPDLDSFAISVAATVTLMFVTVLLVAGSLALEREENTIARLTRGPLRPVELLAEKVALGVIASIAVTLLMLAGLSLFVGLEWGRLPLWLAAIAAGGAGFAALGAAIGTLAPEVRASSLLAIMLALPIAFLSLVPTGAVGATLFDVIRFVRALFPFAPAREALEVGLSPDGAGMVVPLLHLATLTAAYGLLARLAVRRFSQSG